MVLKQPDTVSTSFAQQLTFRLNSIPWRYAACKRANGASPCPSMPEDCYQRLVNSFSVLMNDSDEVFGYSGCCHAFPPVKLLELGANICQKVHFVVCSWRLDCRWKVVIGDMQIQPKPRKWKKIIEEGSTVHQCPSVFSLKMNGSLEIQHLDRTLCCILQNPFTFKSGFGPNFQITQISYFVTFISLGSSASSTSPAFAASTGPQSSLTIQALQVPQKSYHWLGTPWNQLVFALSTLSSFLTSQAIT